MFLACLKGSRREGSLRSADLSTTGNLLRLISDSGEEIEIRQDSVRLGRDRSCEVWLDDRSISRRHAVIQRDGEEGWLVQDQASANGLLLDGRKISRAPLLDGQQLQMGKLRFRVEIAASQEEGTLIANRAALESSLLEDRSRAMGQSPARGQPRYWLWWLAGGAVALLIAASSALLMYLMLTQRETADQSTVAGAKVVAPGPASTLQAEAKAPSLPITTPPEPGAVLLLVASEPCELYVDGVRVEGLTPERALRHSVSLGEHVVSAHAADGRGFKKIVAARRADEQLVIRLELAPARPAQVAQSVAPSAVPEKAAAPMPQPDKLESPRPARLAQTAAPSAAPEKAAAPTPAPAKVVAPAVVASSPVSVPSLQPKPLDVEIINFVGFDSRLKASVVGEQFVEGAPLDVAALAKGVLLLYPERLVAHIPGSRTALVVPRALRLAHLANGAILLQAETAVFAMDQKTPGEQSLPIPAGSQVRGTETESVLMGRQMGGVCRFEEVDLAGRRGAAWEIQGVLRTYAWNRQGFAAVVGNALWVRKPGTTRTQQIDSHEDYAQASSIAPVDSGRVLVALRDRVLVSFAGQRGIAVTMRAQVASNGRGAYLLDPAAGLVWRVDGFSELGPGDVDAAHARKLIEQARLDCKERQPCPKLAEAARVLGPDVVAKLIGR